ncbi:MAG: T9SS type A sorting domain-containing protein [Candidatus Cloacimonadia bacterium]
MFSEKKRIIIGLLLPLFLMGVIGLYALFGGGSGTQEDPWLIETAEQLKYLSTNGYYRQVADIDLGVSPWNEGKGWEPIGITGAAFSGNYDGGGYRISNLYINSPNTSDVGLFGTCFGATLKNIVLENVDVTGRKWVGGLAGQFSGKLPWKDGNPYGNIYNCSVSGSVKADSRAGGLVGYSKYIKMYWSHSDVDVEGFGADEVIGGFAGYLGEGVLISNCYSRGTVCTDNHMSSGAFVGIVNPLEGVVRIENCYAAVEMPSNVKGFLGYSSLPNEYEVINSYWNHDLKESRDNGLEKTTEEMTYPYKGNVYDGWDFDNIWQHDIDYTVNDGYPYLRKDIDIELSADKDNLVTMWNTELNNYPNPFNPETTISLNLPKASEVELAIYNIKGQLIKKLINTHMEAGQHKIVWNGNDVSSGLYFYKLTTPEGSLINKMMLLK